MAVAAAGAVSLPMANARDLLAACSTFQTWVGAGDAAAAKASIHMFWESTDGLSRPFCVIAPARWDTRLEAETGFGWEGRLELLFEADVDAGESEADNAGFDFCNNLGAFYTEMQAKSADPTYMRIKGLSIQGDSIGRSASEENAGDGDYYQGTMELAF